MPKIVIYGEEARTKLKAGVDAIAKAVVTTLGPKGRNVSIERQWTHPHVVHDGVTVAREIELKDPFENQGAQMVKEASSKTNDVAGDGTTTSMVIAAAVVEEGLKNVTAGANPMVLKKGIEAAVDFVNKFLQKSAVKIESKAQMAEVARISSASEEIGGMVADALEKVGKDGTVTAEESGTLFTEIEYKEGLEMKGGWLSPHFVTNVERMEAEVEDCRVLITDRDLSSPNEMLRFLQGMIETHKVSNIVVIANNVEGPALAMLVVNKMKGIIKAIAVKAPRGGERQREILEDIAALTGGKVVSEDRGVELDNFDITDLGSAKKVIATKDTTIIVADKGPAVQERMDALRKSIADAKSPLEKERYEDRLAKLEGGVAVITVGAATEVEMKEKVERVKDAIGATKAALDEGIIPGGGVGLIEAADQLREHIGKLADEDAVAGDEKLGMEIIVRALEKPLWWIAANAGEKADHVVEKVRELNTPAAAGIGYNVYTGKYENMIEVGVIDPVKVSRHAVIHGSSVAMMVLTTECLIAEDPDVPNPLNE